MKFQKRARRGGSPLALWPSPTVRPTHPPPPTHRLLALVLSPRPRCSLARSLVPSIGPSDNPGSISLLPTFRPRFSSLSIAATRRPKFRNRRLMELVWMGDMRGRARVNRRDRAGTRGKCIWRDKDENVPSSRSQDLTRITRFVYFSNGAGKHILLLLLLYC